MKKYLLNLILVFILTIGIISCWSYSFSEKALPGVESIAVQLFNDRTDEIQLSERLQNSIITIFVDENIFTIVGQNQADALLSGVIESIQDIATDVANNERASQFELQINVLVKLADRNSGEAIISERVKGSGLYRDLLGSGEGSRDAAINQALEQVTRDIIDKISSGW